MFCTVTVRLATGVCSVNAAKNNVCFSVLLELPCREKSDSSDVLQGIRRMESDRRVLDSLSQLPAETSEFCW